MNRSRTLQTATLAPDSIPANISSVQAIALGQLLSGQSVTDAARAAGVARCTVHRWLAEDADFIAFHNQARKEMDDAMSQQLRLLAISSVRTIRTLLTRRQTPDSIKLKAASVVLKLTTSKSVEGQTTVEGAENQIAKELKKRGSDRMMAKMGLSAYDPAHRSILERIDPDKVKNADRLRSTSQEDEEDEGMEEED